MQEYEMKTMLTEEEYAALLRSSVESNSKMQINYYYDSETFSLDRQNITCRIRWKDNKFTSCIKFHDTDQRLMSRETVLGSSAFFHDSLFCDLGLELQGTLITQRSPLFHTDKIVACLDRNWYLGKVDYELEIEYLSGCESDASCFLEETALSLWLANILSDPKDLCSRKGHALSKSRRFFIRKRKWERGES